MPAAYSENILEMGRALGWDFALYGIQPWNPDLPGVAEGYAAGKASVGLKKPSPDRFVRKHLQVRSNALRRNKLVDANFTVEFLREIDFPTCPVTLEPLTHAEQRDTDWSVDRINNNGAYANGNLAILSTRANEAKGDRSFEQVYRLSQSTDPTDSLTPSQWLRLAVIMFGPCATEDKSLYDFFPLPLATRIPNNIVRPIHFQLQRFVLDAAKNAANLRTARQWLKSLHLSQGMTDRWELVVHYVAKNLRRGDYAYDSLVDDEIQRRLTEWLRSLSQGQHIALRDLLTGSLGGGALHRKTVESWSLGTRGRLI